MFITVVWRLKLCDRLSTVSCYYWSLTREFNEERIFKICCLRLESDLASGWSPTTAAFFLLFTPYLLPIYSLVLLKQYHACFLSCLTRILFTIRGILLIVRERKLASWPESKLSIWEMSNFVPRVFCCRHIYWLREDPGDEVEIRSGIVQSHTRAVRTRKGTQGLGVLSRFALLARFEMEGLLAGEITRLKS